MSYVVQRRQEEKDRRRNEILAAAEAVFAEVGVEKATMEQVARKARLSRALLYVYFEDKEDLVTAICVRALTELRKRFVAASARPKTGLDKIESLGQAYVTFAQEEPVYFAALARFEAEVPRLDGSGNEASCLKAGDAVHELMVEILGKGVEDGSIRKDLGDRKLTAITLWGFMHGILQIISNKANVLAYDGVTPRQLVRHALELARRAMAPPRR